jgi:hypothetical protein
MGIHLFGSRWLLHALVRGYLTLYPWAAVKAITQSFIIVIDNKVGGDIIYV